jgi:hypothetical protein
MSFRRIFLLILFVGGLAVLCLFFTPFIDNISGRVVHAPITFAGNLIVGRFLIYVVGITAACLVIAIIGQRKNPA